jgi:acetylornithine/succinyldiaminopimelate/putrescine aminotransferase
MVHPALGHITTFGGHPLSCAASLAAFEELTQTTLISDSIEKEKLFREKLQHPLIQEVRGKGLFLSLRFPSEEMNRNVIRYCIEQGVLVDWFLFAPDCLRIAPPLVISREEIVISCKIIVDALNKI